MAESTASRIIEVSEVEWQTMHPGILAKPLWSDSTTKRRVQLTRFEPGAKLNLHRHDGDEILYVIEGAISDEFGTVTAGNLGYRPNGCVHSVVSKRGATVFAFITGGVAPATDGERGPASQVIRLNEIAWVDALPGIRQKPIFSDKETRRRVVLARFDPGAKLPRHRHVGDEIVFVIEGSNADESGELVAGNMNYRPNGCAHSVWSTNGATALAFVTGTVEPAAMD
ncbi:MAG: cupin domain-containing protein [Candidatus Binataceae bacterium]|jgi:anti-sigma factor ChrR (cupin superfamily)